MSAKREGRASTIQSEDTRKNVTSLLHAAASWFCCFSESSEALEPPRSSSINLEGHQRRPQNLATGGGWITTTLASLMTAKRSRQGFCNIFLRHLCRGTWWPIQRGQRGKRTVPSVGRNGRGLLHIEPKLLAPCCSTTRGIQSDLVYLAERPSSVRERLETRWAAG